MSTEAVQAVLERTVTDPSFRTRLFTQPDQALADIYVYLQSLPGPSDPKGVALLKD